MSNTTIINIPAIEIDPSEVMRYAGATAQSEFPSEIVKEAIDQVQIIAHPRACWRSYPYDAATKTIQSTPHFQPGGNSIGSHLSDAIDVTCLAVTIGAELEAAVEKAFADGRYSYGLLLDAAATALVEAAADYANRFISRIAARKGYFTRWRFSPGYGDWPLNDQTAYLKICGGAEIGIDVTETCLLVPRKSITAIIGICTRPDEEIERTTCKPGQCRDCRNISCPVRKE